MRLIIQDLVCEGRTFKFDSGFNSTEEIWSQYSGNSILEQLNVFREFCYLSCTKTGFSLSLNSGTSSLFAELPSSKASNIKRNAVLHKN